jgi:hypothetical protein
MSGASISSNSATSRGRRTKCRAPAGRRTFAGRDRNAASRSRPP